VKILGVGLISVYYSSVVILFIFDSIVIITGASETVTKTKLSEWNLFNVPTLIMVLLVTLLVICIIIIIVLVLFQRKRARVKSGALTSCVLLV